jgi:hypothetical protein
MIVPALNVIVTVLVDRHGNGTVFGQSPDAVEIGFDYGSGCQNARATTGRFEVAGINARDLVAGGGGLPFSELARRIRSQNKMSEVKLNYAAGATAWPSLTAIAGQPPP